MNLNNYLTPQEWYHLGEVYPKNQFSESPSPKIITYTNIHTTYI